MRRDEFDLGKETVRVESLAEREAMIINLALGLVVDPVPKKVVNPKKADVARLVANTRIDGLGKRLAELYVADTGGCADPDDNVIYDFGGREYMVSMFGVDQSLMLSGVTDVSLHETAHIWMAQNCDPTMVMTVSVSELITKPKEFVEMAGGMERMICLKVISEGIATYAAKRCNDYIRGFMVEAVRNNVGDKEGERCAREYATYYDCAVVSGGEVVEEDLVMMEEYIHLLTSNNLIKRIKNVSSMRDFSEIISYRLGYNLISRMVDVRRDGDMSEADALLDIVGNLPVSVKQIKEILRV